jgi:glutamate--cysteine ligase
MNWGNVVKEGRNPNLKLLKNKEKVSIKDSGMAVIDSLRNIFEQMPPEMNEYTKKVFKSLDRQEEKFNNASLTPSGKIVTDLRNNNKTWEELNLELAKQHSDSLEKIRMDLSYLSEEAQISLGKFKELEAYNEEEFDVYLDKFVNDI